MKSIVSWSQNGKRRALVLALSLGLAAGVMALQVINSEARDSKTQSESHIAVHTGSVSKSGNANTDTALQDTYSRFNSPFSMLRAMRHAPDAAWLLRNMEAMSSDLDQSWSMPVGISAYMPKIDTTEQGNNIQITAEVPGIDEKDLDVVVNDDSVTIRGNKKEEIANEGNKSSSKTIERSYGSFERSIGFPYRVQRDKAEAVLKNGVLTITVPKNQLAMSAGKKLTIQQQ